MLLLGLTACQKEEATIPGVNSTTELNVTPRVKAFVDRANHHAVDAGRDAISADSAVWYLEAGVNYSTAQALYPQWCCASIWHSKLRAPCRPS